MEVVLFFLLATTLELNMSLCCDRCAKQVKEALEDVEG
jgi:hypothetical protein